MSEYYEATNDNPTSCNFDGNATIHSGVPATSSAAISAATSCLSNPSATFVPVAPSGSGSSGSGSGSGSGGSGSNNSSGALPLFGSTEAWMGLTVSCLFGVLGFVLTLA